MVPYDGKRLWVLSPLAKQNNNSVAWIDFNFASQISPLFKSLICRASAVLNSMSNGIDATAYRIMFNNSNATAIIYPRSRHSSSCRSSDLTSIRVSNGQITVNIFSHLRCGFIPLLVLASIQKWNYFPVRSNWCAVWNPGINPKSCLGWWGKRSTEPRLVCTFPCWAIKRLVTSAYSRIVPVPVNSKVSISQVIRTQSTAAT